MSPRPRRWWSHLGPPGEGAGRDDRWQPDTHRCILTPGRFQALSVRTRSVRVMPWLWKNAAARGRKPAQAVAFSAGWISLWARREWSSAAGGGGRSRRCVWLGSPGFRVAAGVDPAESPDVHVDQLAGPTALVAAHDLSGGPVEERPDGCGRAGSAHGAPSRPACGPGVGGISGLRLRQWCSGAVVQWCRGVSFGGGWSGRRVRFRPRTAGAGATCGRQAGRCPTPRRPAQRDDDRSRHGRRAVACRERPAGLHGGTRRSPRGEDSTPSPHTEAVAMIRSRRRRQCR